MDVPMMAPYNEAKQAMEATYACQFRTIARSSIINLTVRMFECSQYASRVNMRNTPLQIPALNEMQLKYLNTLTFGSLGF